MHALAITKPRTAMQKKRSSHHKRTNNEKKRPDLTNMRLQSTSFRFLFPIWMLVWLTVATIKSCLAEETNDDDFPVYEYECENPCEEGSFCGRDLKCHTYSCDNWYTLGHPTMTRYAPDKSPALKCEILENGQDRSFLTQGTFCFDGLLPISVAFYLDGCKAHLTCSYDSVPVAHLNRKCTSTPSDGFGFVCYDMDPDTDFEAYYEDYIAATADLDRVPCTEYETITDNHGYAVDVATPETFFINTFFSSEFNVTLATRTIVAKLFEVRLNATLFPLCEDGCKDTEFCGQDGTCHEYNCVNVYAYGPKTVTGHDYQETSAPKLECSPEPPTEDDTNICLDNTVESPWPLLIRYHCSLRAQFLSSSVVNAQITPETCAYEFLDGRYVTLNRFCSAQPNPYQNFTCYDMYPDTDIEQYLADYLNKTTLHSECTKDNLNPDSCPFEHATVTYHGRHSYETCIGSVPTPGSHKTDCSFVFGSVLFDDRELVPIDFERLRYVMTSNIVGNLPEEDGTSPFDISSISTRNVIGSAITFVFALIGLIVQSYRRHRGSTWRHPHFTIVAERIPEALK